MESDTPDTTPRPHATRRKIPPSLSVSERRIDLVIGVTCLLLAVWYWYWYWYLSRSGELNRPKGLGFGAVGLSLISAMRIFGYQMRERFRAPMIVEHQAAIDAGLESPYEVMLQPADPYLHLSHSSQSLAIIGLCLGPAFVFGPAAIATGIIAAIKGHRRGLWGITLGMVSVLIWGWFFSKT